MNARRLAVATLVLAAMAGGARAQEQQRKYQMIRSDEDWAWLDELPPEKPDAFDAVKHAEIGESEQWYASLGGFFRTRFEDDDNRFLGGSPIEDDFNIKSKASLAFEIGHEQDFRFFTEVRAAEMFDNERPEPVFFHDDPDFLSFFLEGTIASKSTHPVTIRAGRQEMRFGVGRLVAPLDWWSTRRTFEGIRVIADTPRTSTSVFVVNTVDNEPHDTNTRIQDQRFYGVHSTLKPTNEHLIELAAFLLHDSRDIYGSESGLKSDLERQTYDVRYAYKGDEGWRAEFEGAYQQGNVGEDDLAAWFATGSVGYAWTDAAWKPRVALGLDHASGDDDPTDGDRGTFDPMFPDGHLFLGSMDLVGRSNIDAARIEFEAFPLPKLRWLIGAHRFWLAEDSDALYDSNSKPIRRDATGLSGDDVGLELDMHVAYTFATHHWLGFEICKWWSGDFIANTGNPDDAWFAWMAYEFTF